MKKIVFLFITSLAIISFTSCNKEKVNKVNPSDIEVNLDKSELQTRIEMINAPLTLNSFKAGGTTTPVPELWAIARILPDTRTYSIWYYAGTYNGVLYEKQSPIHLDGSVALPYPVATTIAAPNVPSTQLIKYSINSFT